MIDKKQGFIKGALHVENQVKQQPMRMLENKVAIITGASRGIGKATALRMSEEGAKIVVSARSFDKLTKICEKINTQGGSAIAVSCDLSNEAEIDSVIQTAIQTYRRIDILANIGQGDTEGQTLDNLSVKEATYAYQTGPISSMLFMQKCFPYMRKQHGGSIINVSSRYVDIGGEGFAAFGMAKSAIEALTHMAAVEWGKYGIRTNCIRPIAMQDELPKLHSQAINASMKNKIPLGYLAMPYKDIAPLIIYLASDYACYLNGAVISADGGLSRCSSTK